MISRTDVPQAEKPTMCLSIETQEGLRMTGIHFCTMYKLYSCMHFCIVNSFVEVVRYLLNLPGGKGKYILSECFSQDPLENYFGQLRARGGRSDNPTVKSCLDSAQSLRIQKSLALQPVRGNCSRKRRLFAGTETIDNEPLQKKSRK